MKSILTIQKIEERLGKLKSVKSFLPNVLQPSFLFKKEGGSSSEVRSAYNHICSLETDHIIHLMHFLLFGWYQKMR